MSDMKVSVGLWREPGTDLFIFSFCQILLYNLFNKIFGDRRSLFFFYFLIYFFFHLFPPQ